MLAFGIRYLNGYAAATSIDDHRRPEWPPHPARVFMALAAAHFQGGDDPGEHAALCWLERLERGGQPAAPFIAASHAMPRAIVTHYVPVNDDPGNSTAPLQSVALTRTRQPRSFARAWLDDDTAFLWWPEAEPDKAIQGALTKLCAKVARIGHSSSLVQMWVAEAGGLPQPNWIPDEERATIQLRVAVPGTLEYLEQQFNAAAIDDFTALLLTERDTTDKGATRSQAALADGIPERAATTATSEAVNLPWLCTSHTRSARASAGHGIQPPFDYFRSPADRSALSSSRSWVRAGNRAALARGAPGKQQ